MSSSVRHSFHTAADPNGLGLTGGSVPAEPAAEPKRPVPIVVSSSDAQGAFDLFQPEPTNRPSPVPMPLVSLTPGATVAEFSQGQFSRQVARALSQQPAAVEAPETAGPSAAEVASARALTIAWLTAALIAFFAFLSQGPTISSSRTADDAVKPPAATDSPAAPAALRPGDIRLDAPAEKPAQAVKARKPAPKPATPASDTPPQPQP